MIGHDIQDQSQVAFTQLVVESSEVCVGSQLWVQTRWIGHVVSMGAASPAAEDRRCVYVGDAKFREIVDDFAAS